MRYIYAPGCALMSYKPHLAEKLKEEAERRYGPMETLLTCCFSRPELEAGTCILTPCVTCAQEYRKHYPECTAKVLLEDIASDPDFPFPDYQGFKMSIQDTCAARTEPEALKTIRTLLERMDITLMEPEKTGARAKCCGQVLYGKADISKVENFMKTRAGEMPCEDVVVYCASCIMSMTVGGRQPRYILDLLYHEPTDMAGMGVCKWNELLKDFRNSH